MSADFLAPDRLWQMDLFRRQGRGLLSIEAIERRLGIRERHLEVKRPLGVAVEIEPHKRNGVAHLLDALPQVPPHVAAQ